MDEDICVEGDHAPADDMRLLIVNQLGPLGFRGKKGTSMPGSGEFPSTDSLPRGRLGCQEQLRGTAQRLGQRPLSVGGEVLELPVEGIGQLDLGLDHDG